jgi:hypothetical protein
MSLEQRTDNLGVMSWSNKWTLSHASLRVVFSRFRACSSDNGQNGRFPTHLWKVWVDLQGPKNEDGWPHAHGTNFLMRKVSQSWQSLATRNLTIAHFQTDTICLPCGWIRWKSQVAKPGKMDVARHHAFISTRLRRRWPLEALKWFSKLTVGFNCISSLAQSRRLIKFLDANPEDRSDLPTGLPRGLQCWLTESGIWAEAVPPALCLLEIVLPMYRIYSAIAYCATRSRHFKNNVDPEK